MYYLGIIGGIFIGAGAVIIIYDIYKGFKN